MADTVVTAAPVTKQPKAHRPRKSHIIVMLGSLVAGSAAAVTFLDSWQKVFTEFGFTKSEAFVLADKTAQGDLVRQMTHLVSQRVFWIARYGGEVADGFPKEDQDDAWKRYNDSVVVWNENYMVNVLLTEKYFGTAIKNQLADINWLLRRINTCLNRIHYRSLYESKDAACHFDGIDGGTQEQNIAALNKTLDRVDTAFGTFIQSLAK